MLSLSIMFLTIPYVYYAVIIMETILIVTYKKIITGNAQLSNEVLGSVISAAHFTVKDDDCKYKILQKWDGVGHKIILHVLSMILILIPSQVLLTYTSLYEDHNNPLGFNVQLLTIGMYFAALIPFVTLSLIRIYFFNNWNLLRKEAKTERIQMDDRGVTATQGKRGVDPFDPRSYMDKNLEEVHKKLVKNDD